MSQGIIKYKQANNHHDGQMYKYVEGNNITSNYVN